MRTELVSLLNHEKEEDKARRNTKRKKLHEAAIKGSVPSLLQILHEDPLILRPSPLSSPVAAYSPLHVAALLGYLDFARELLTRNPELAGSQSPGGSTPLHLASAKGYVEIVKELTLVNPDMCFAFDLDGRSPIHLAVIKGRVGVLTELVRVRQEATRVLTRGGESCLHLCVKYHRLEALKAVVGSLEGEDEFVNWKDGDGNTVLHLAVAKKQLEIIKFLLARTAIEVNARNVNGLTALDVLSISPRDLRDIEIKECLQGHGTMTRFNSVPSNIVNGEIEEVPSISTRKNLQGGSSIKQQPNKHKHTDWLGRKRNALMVVASLIATVAFQAAISPPGGVWQNDFDGDSSQKSHEAGKSVMARNIPKAYGQFMIFDTIAFLASLSIILLQISGLPIKRRRWMWSQMVTMWIAITALTITYFLALIHMTPNNVLGTLYQVTKISVLGWLTLMAIVFIGNVIRMILWLLRNHGYIKKKEDPTNEEEDDDKDDLFE
ncbi:Ankyrin repeat-containing protein [Actinidia chinensis var. chinensis]|uniref:Ankyrin repeat-containing protein n=1 Tax=Actinidia chinensis var. chinensis TaxID=1590841 RepID=A0A2R6QYW3_ACTCC|nr:Ankyrin repeat-containing protein [Actinidia chinensis var. chinensis]